MENFPSTRLLLWKQGFCKGDVALPSCAAVEEGRRLQVSFPGSGALLPSIFAAGSFSGRSGLLKGLCQDVCATYHPAGANVGIGCRFCL